MATTKTVNKTAQATSSSQKKKPLESKAASKAPSTKKEAIAPAVTPPKPSTKKPAEPKTTTEPVTVVQAEAPAIAATPTATTAADGKWSEVRRILLEMKEQTLLEIKRSIKKGSEASVGEEPTGDIYDQASIERDRELGLLLNDREREKVHSIDEALLRIAEGEYGICEECDEDIPMGRLKVLPFTRHCVKCKSDLEKFQAQTRRIEEDRAYREIPVGDDDEG